uniref:RGS domain-containing protein n=1 Tax=Gasterosteus aculeatus aculeatus TaxID=481459 RepID=A0AAQ4PQT7_GASAC
MQDKSLAADDVLAHYFNDFLTLPCFAEAVLYHRETGLFVSQSVLRCSKPRPLTGASTPPVDNRLATYWLHREEGIQWVIKERLPFFLQSDGYNEYRLSKMLLQKNTTFRIQRRKDSPTPSHFDMDNSKAPNSPPCLHSQETRFAKQGSLGTHNVKCLPSDQKEHVVTSTPGLDEFKDFLRGRQGEKLLNLWMDITRLKATRTQERKSRYLVVMRNRYLLSCSRISLNVELLCRLGLTTSLCWTEEKLHSVQPLLIESLLSYWVPRFWTSRRIHGGRDDSPYPELRAEWCVRPESDTQPHRGSNTLCSETRLPLCHHAVHTQLYSSRSQFPGSRRMEKALSVEFYAGLYFSNFCEQSGNQLWENALYFWTDLQHYHELFHQDGLDTYRVQREAQLLHSSYLLSFARRSIGVGEEIRREVYDQLVPAFKELFDKVEEHALHILLEPWTLLVSRDEQSFQTVCVQEEVRCIDSQEPGEHLYKESVGQLKQVEQFRSELFPSPVTPSSPFSKGPRAPDSRSRVSPNYKGYRLGSLLCHPRKIGHLMSFLQNQDASIHLTCWLDLEQYMRTPQKDKAVRQRRATNIATKYLNRKYFFGSASPATTEQQNAILRLAGGLERLGTGYLFNSVVREIQDIVSSYIEKKWLPLYMSSAEFTQQQEHKPKADSLWMTAAKEILLFRRTLLDPVTCTRFQHFVSLKGDFPENNVRFWLEAQRYKDLCHSHSDEATIQQKSSTIINGFIDASTPPALQIDIPPQQAQRVLENRNRLGPCLFREAQTSVFSALLKFWPQFQELSSTVQVEQPFP